MQLALGHAGVPKGQPVNVCIAAKRAWLCRSLALAPQLDGHLRPAWQRLLRFGHAEQRAHGGPQRRNERSQLRVVCARGKPAVARRCRN